MGNGGTVSSNTPVKTTINTGITAGVGEGHIAALGQNGKVYTWGKNNAGQLGIGNTTNNTVVAKIADGITDISAAGNETIVKDVEGNVYGTGLNTNGALGIGTNSNVTTLTKMTLPDIVTGENSNPDDVGASSARPHVKYIKAGTTNTTLMLSDGTVWSSGLNTNGELGNGSNTNSNTFVQGLTLVENKADTGTAHTEEQPLTSVLTIGRNTGLNTAVILENGDIYTTGDNTYSQIGDGTKTSTNYYKKMGFVILDYKDKIVPVHEQGHQLDKNKLRYIIAKINAYNKEEEIEYTLGEIKYTSLDETIATVSETGLIIGKVPSGEVQIKIEDITNGYETYVTAKVNINRLENTDTVEYIYNIEDLIKFRDSVNAGNDYAGKTVYLMADIDMSAACSETSGISWEPIGNNASDGSLTFAGTFEGNYHKLSNLYINSNGEYQYLGLFIQNKGTIQDLILENINAKINTANNVYYLGGICGKNNGKINNIGIESGIITNTSTVNNKDYTQFAVCGGIVGHNGAGGVINGCYNKASVSAIHYNGYCQMAGGIAGCNDWSGFVSNSYNAGNIYGYADSGARTGGIVGETYNNINNCYNYGSVHANTSCYAGLGVIYNGIYNNSYCTTESVYSYIYSRNSDGGITDGRIAPETLKTYAGTLGSAYENDDFNINDGYPILWWQAPTIELNKKQAYIGVTETLQLKLVGAHSVRPLENLENVAITDFEWKSTNEDVATVDQNALVTGVSEGYTTIYGAHKEYNNVNVECIINVSKADSIATPQIETGNGFTVILKADGTVWMTGNDMTVPAQIKINENEYLTNVIKISAGPNHVLALTKDGEVYAWGDNTYGQLGNGVTGNSITETGDDMAQVGAPSGRPTGLYAKKVSGEGGASTLKRIVDISAGKASSTAVNEFGWVFVWGNGTYGEMGNGGTVSSNTPVKTTISTGISSSLGTGHVVTLGQSGKAYTWGRNTYGELGTGNTSNSTVVAKIAEGITEISAGGYETIVKDVEGKVYGTGLNTNGALGIGTNSNVTTLTEVTLPDITGPLSERGVKYIKAGEANTTILLKNGTVWSTGLNTNGELGIGTNDNKNTFVQGLTLVENKDITENQNPDVLTSNILPLTSVLTIGRNNGPDTPVILENGKIYIAGSNEFKQITNEEADTKYFTEMRYITIIAPEKIEVLAGRTKKLTEEELEYRKDTFNVYEDDILIIPLIDYAQIEDENLATYNKGEIRGILVGKTELKVEEESTKTTIYIPVRVYEVITGKIITENYMETHIATVKLYRRRKKEGDEYEDEYEEDLIKEVETDKDGTYVLDIDEIGVYDVLVTKAGYLDYKVAEIEIKQDAIVEIQEYKLIAGDVAEDGEIEINDLVDMNRNLGEEITEDNKKDKEIFDLNEDGKIDRKDRDIVKKNYGKRAEETKWVNTNATIALMNLNIVEDNVKTVEANEINGRPQGAPTDETKIFILPMSCKYTITSEYGTRIHPTTKESKLHAGIDLVGTHHTEILSVADGTITFAGVQNGYGNCIEIKHTINGKTIYSFYAHLSRIDVEVGDKVVKGQVIGLQGGGSTDDNPGTSTGEHLHFEIRTASGSGHSINPREYIQF